MFNPKNDQVFESLYVIILDERQVAEVPVPEETHSTVEPMVFTSVDQQEIMNGGQLVAVVNKQQAVAGYHVDVRSLKLPRIGDEMNEDQHEDVFHSTGTWTALRSLRIRRK